MYLKSLQLKNFRNYKSASVSFDSGLNVLKGENASGKTNLVEAVYLLGLGKSPRTANEKELIKIGEEHAYVKAVVQKKYRSHTIEVFIDKSGKKIKIDGIPALRAAELIGVLSVVYFSPDELKFIKEGPAERRKFLDIALSQQSANYFRTLQKYNRILKQRNKLLKTDGQNPHIGEMLSVWDGQLAAENANLVLMRRNFLSDLGRSVAAIHDALTDGKEVLTLSYESDAEGDTFEELTAAQLAVYEKNRDKDVQYQFTVSGAHRDDFKIGLNGNDARKIASQGQQRTAALSILIGELEMFKNETGEMPVLVLDDVLSELDENRRKQLLSATFATQTLLTCTEFNEEVPEKQPKIFTVSQGTIK